MLVVFGIFRRDWSRIEAKNKLWNMLTYAYYAPTLTNCRVDLEVSAVFLIIYYKEDSFLFQPLNHSFHFAEERKNFWQGV